jgi:hypothetical protein
LAVLSETKHGGIVPGHVTVADDLSTHWALAGFIPREEAGIVYPPQEFHFMRELGGCEGGVSAVDCEVCAAGMCCSQKVTVFGGVLERGDSMGKTVFPVIEFEARVY